MRYLNVVFPIYFIILLYLFTFQFKLEYDQLLSRTIAASVWHSSFAQKNKCLGEALVSIDDYLNSGFSLEDPSPQWYTLKGRVRKYFINYSISEFIMQTQEYLLILTPHISSQSKASIYVYFFCFLCFKFFVVIFNMDKIFSITIMGDYTIKIYLILFILK